MNDRYRRQEEDYRKAVRTLTATFQLVVCIFIPMAFGYVAGRVEVGQERKQRMAKNLFYLDTGREGFHFARLKDGNFFLHTTNEKGQFSNGVTIPKQQFGELVDKLNEVRDEMVYREKELANGLTSCGRCNGTGQSPNIPGRLCVRCGGTGKPPVAEPETDPEPISDGSPTYAKMNRMK